MNCIIGIDLRIQAIHPPLFQRFTWINFINKNTDLKGGMGNK
jgi:hypothetical protein